MNTDNQPEKAADDDQKTPRFGTLKGRITINDPNWWKPMSEEDVAAFLEGRYDS